MARAFYNYTITILEKVSFNPELFVKELEKSYKALLPYEQKELRIWLQQFLSRKPQLIEYIKKYPVFMEQEINEAS